MKFILFLFLFISQGLKASSDCEENWRKTSDYARAIAEEYGRKIESQGIRIDFKPHELEDLFSSIYRPDHKIGILNGEEVYLKPIILRRFRIWPPPWFWHEVFDEGHGARELNIYYAFNDLQIPTLFKGTVLSKSGSLYMALQFKEGKFIKWCMKESIGKIKGLFF